MLTIKEAGMSLKVFKILSVLNILPIGVDVKSGKIQRQTNKVKVFIWKFLFGVGVSHWFYVFGRLVQSTVIEPEKYFRWDHFVIHFGFACAATVFYYTGFCLFVKSAEENVMIFNQLFLKREDPVQKIMVHQEIRAQRRMQTELNYGQGIQTQVFAAQEPFQEMGNQDIAKKSKILDRARARPLLTWPPQYSLDELMAKLVPFIAVFTGICFILFLAVDPSRPQLLYSSLPSEWQNPWSFLILLAVEAICTTMIYFTGTFAIVIQVLFFGKCQLEFKRMSLQLRNLQQKFQNRSHEIGIGGRDLEREIWILRQISEEMRELVVVIELFNRCYPFCIFAWKINCLSLSIVYYFFVIRHFQDFPVLAAFMAYSAIVTTLICTIMYEHAFSIPRKMDELKNEFLLTARKTKSESNANVNENKKLWAEMKRRIQRIQNVGIKVGSFHQMERESTPKFIDFVLRTVVTLLVTFPRSGLKLKK